MQREARHELLRAAIDDIQGSIHANDSKSAAALVVHALLATAVVALSTHLDSLYDKATRTVQHMLVGVLLAVLACFVASVVELLRSIAPYEPRAVGGRIAREYAHLFFPDIESLAREARSVPQRRGLRFIGG